MATITLDTSAFREMFPAYASETDYPDATLTLWYGVGKCYIKDNDYVLAETCRENALMMMLAHLLYIQDLVNAGTTTRLIASASESDVNLSLVEPPNTSNFTYWLYLSPYGQMIIPMLEIAFAGGCWSGNTPLPELSGGN